MYRRLLKRVYQTGRSREIGLMYVNVMYRVHALLLRLQLMVSDGVLAYHIKNGIYGQTQLDGLNVLVLSYFKGTIWETKATEEQREALHMI